MRRHHFLLAALALAIGGTACRAQEGEAHGSGAYVPDRALALTTAASAGAASATRGSAVARVRWRGKTYDAVEALPLLVRVVCDPAATTPQRNAASEKLRRVMGLPEASAYVGRLMGAYLREDGSDVQYGILMCLARSNDRVVLGFLDHVNRNTDDPVRQLLAAGGLARWNARSGVRRLIDLLDARSRLPQRPVGDEALIKLMHLTKRKDWGFPAETLRSELAGCDSTTASRIARQRWRAWFAENEWRFPVVPPKLQADWRKAAGLAPSRRTRRPGA